jgi:hypothetical protein
MRNHELYAELDTMPDLAIGQADSLKLDSRQLDTEITFDHGADGVLVWIDRTEPGRISAERCVNGRMEEGDDADILDVVAAARFDGVMPG